MPDNTSPQTDGAARDDGAVGTVPAWRAIGYAVGLLAFMVGTAIFMVGFALRRPDVLDAGCWLYGVSGTAVSYRMFVRRYLSAEAASWVRPTAYALLVGAAIFVALEGALGLLGA